jgi:hypothetical protein
MNPIVRMMKRYIETPLKYALPLLFICSIALVSISGCTSTTNNSSSGGGNAVSVTESINTAYSQGGYKVVTPFTQSTDSSGNTVYKGVVDDGAAILQPYQNNITIVMASNRQSALGEYNASIAQAQTNGYTVSANQGTSWWGAIGSISYPNTQVKITVDEPSIAGVNVYGTNPYLNINSNSYAVCTDYQSPISS